jgi:hypothetical protein
MGNPKEEREVFDEFVKLAPLFAGVAVMSRDSSKQEPADIECDLVDGSKVGVQLTTWIDGEQMNDAKRIEGIEKSLLRALGPLPRNETEHFATVWLYAKWRVKAADAQAFRAQFLQFIAELDKRWDREPDLQSPQGFQVTDFGASPILAKYLDALEVHPQRSSVPSTMTRRSTGWITIEPTGGPFSADEMVDALCDRVQEKISKYAATPTGMSRFYLLVHYDKAWTYNSPVKGIDFGYNEAVKAVSERIGRAVGVFDGIFVLVRVTDERQVFRLYP